MDLRRTGGKLECCRNLPRLYSFRKFCMRSSDSERAAWSAEPSGVCLMRSWRERLFFWTLATGLWSRSSRLTDWPCCWPAGVEKRPGQVQQLQLVRDFFYNFALQIKPCDGVRISILVSCWGSGSVFGIRNRTRIRIQVFILISVGFLSGIFSPDRDDF
jgi:hypothetical protein